MQLSNNISKWLGGEEMDWTAHTFMDECVTAAAMKLGPHAIKN